MWGLTDNDGISKLAATSPLNVWKDDQVIQVYTQAKYPSGISIPYFYLGNLDKVPEAQQIAGTFIGIIISTRQSSKNIGLLGHSCCGIPIFPIRKYGVTPFSM